MTPAPLDQVPRCSTECSISGSPKLDYQKGKTYIYEYSGNSLIQLEGVQDGVTETKWSKKVEFTWLSPCDMAISIKETKVDGTTG